MQQQRELSLQHIVNKLTFNSQEGISSNKKAMDFMRASGVCVESQCHHHGELVKRKCYHKELSKLYVF